MKIAQALDNKLSTEFRRIQRDHHRANRERAARVVLGPSIMRVYAKGTAVALRRLLPKIDVDQLPQIGSQKEYNAWFDRSLNRVARIIEHHNAKNRRIRPGLKWGHAAKILAIFVRDLVIYSRYFSDDEARRISYYLHAPIDGIVVARLRRLNAAPPFSKLKDITTRKMFYDVQETLTNYSAPLNVPRVWFDDNWGDRQT